MESPTSYVVIDTETNDFHNPFVIQLGFCKVEEQEITAVGNFNIVPLPDILITEGAQKVHGLTRETLEKIGSAPSEILPEIRETLCHFGNGWMMGQNFTFDTNALNCTFRRLDLKEIDFTQMKFIDVGVIFKAHRLMTEWGWGGRAQRKVGGSEMGLHDFYKFIRAQRAKGLKWNLDFCMEWFKVDAPERGDHDASEDCRLTHLIYQKMLEQGIIEEVLFSGTEYIGGN